MRGPSEPLDLILSDLERLNSMSHIFEALHLIKEQS